MPLIVITQSKSVSYNAEDSVTASDSAVDSEATTRKRFWRLIIGRCNYWSNASC